MSHPAWGEWIEISRASRLTPPVIMSHPAWGEWIEISLSEVLKNLD